ncbi:R.Pab1 family restriction endonuclease [Patescibacteria group bacterium]|nr:R.Pab1 family restriction endonuclease [Patescibacteria group bacterium]MBU4057422.1 R.Pab1 family restriction endonuclease [Patescibacteria group bacterium]MBU4115697.1 R.Pab1 family restriction endonuclease [Patescibacteria group bacterium]
MNFEVKNNKIIINIPATNAGKFQFKTRETGLGFGEIFATRSKNFNEKIYLEWQLGYDATISDIKAGKKETQLKKFSFIGDNRKEKYLYELSELVYEAIKIGLIPKTKMSNLLKEIENYSNFIDERKIEVGNPKKVKINDILFEETSIKLPAFFMTETVDGTQVEIHIKQQQNASGTQPMVYFCIPIETFRNYKDLLGRPSAQTDILIYELNKDSAQVLFDLVKIFAMCSKRHNYDIIQILKLILEQSYE